ncbi:MAG: hypothetical protein AB7N71_02120, partial [Phycisphaerae bacterium]
MRAIKILKSVFLAAGCAASAADAGTFIWSGGTGNWSNGALWGGSSPTAGADVLIDNGNAAASSVLFDTTISIANLTIDANDELDMSSGSRNLTVTGSILNDGVLRIADSVSGGAQQLLIQGEVPLNGSGMLLFDSNDDNRILAGLNSATDRLVVGANQLITTSSLSLTDESFIQVRVTNNGIIEANVGQLDLETHPKINANLMRAVNGGFLRLQTTIDNNGADIEADATSTVGLSGATIVGGTLGGSGVFAVDIFDVTFDGTGETVTIGSGATVEAVDATGQRITLKGTIVNDGEIVLREIGANVNDVGIDGPVALLGSGQLRLEGNDDSRINAIVSGTADVLTIGPNQTITTNADTAIGNAFINCRVVNNGVVEANEGELEFNTHNPKINNNIMRARGGGNLFFNGSLVENAGATLTADAGSTVTYTSTHVNGGTL